eukprot:Pgem_evm1s16607
MVYNNVNLKIPKTSIRSKSFGDFLSSPSCDSLWQSIHSLSGNEATSVRELDAQSQLFFSQKEIQELKHLPMPVYIHLNDNEAALTDVT